MDDIVFLNFPAYLFYLVYLALTGHWGAGFDTDLWFAAMAAWERFKIYTTIISLLLLMGAVYSKIRIWQVEQDEVFVYGPLEVAKEGTADERWERILVLVSSEHPAEWRQAVLEADHLLDLALRERGYPGDSLGERLKHAGGLRTINDAWSAHRMRNAVAHGGADFILTQRDARSAIEMYRATLTELNVL